MPIHRCHIKGYRDAIRVFTMDSMAAADVQLEISPHTGSGSPRGGFPNRGYAYRRHVVHPDPTPRRPGTLLFYREHMIDHRAGLGVGIHEASLTASLSLGHPEAQAENVA